MELCQGRQNDWSYEINTKTTTTKNNTEFDHASICDTPCCCRIWNMIFLPKLPQDWCFDVLWSRIRGKYHVEGLELILFGKIRELLEMPSYDWRICSFITTRSVSIEIYQTRSKFWSDQLCGRFYIPTTYDELYRRNHEAVCIIIGRANVSPNSFFRNENQPLTKGGMWQTNVKKL